MGRGLENDIAIDSGSVSVQHAEMHRIAGGYELRDVGSTNGIKLNGERMDVIPLHNGAQVHIGDVQFGFVLSEEELSVLAHEAPGTNAKIIKESDLPPPPKPTPRRPSYETARSGGGGGSSFVFFLLALAAFFAGLAVRHEKETGQSLLDSLKNRFSQEAPAVPATPTAAPAAADPAPAPAAQPE